MEGPLLAQRRTDCQAVNSSEGVHRRVLKKRRGALQGESGKHRAKLLRLVLVLAVPDPFATCDDSRNF
jgi:hypothetical protein